MAAPCFIAWNASTTALSSPMSGTASSATSGTVKTILQVKSPAASKIRVVEWGYLFLAPPTAPVQMELIETGTVFATVSTGSIANFNDVTGYSSLCTTGTTATGFNASGEGTVTATRLLAQTFDLSTYFKQQFPLGREPEINEASSLRIRATPSVSVATTIVAYIAWEE